MQYQRSSNVSARRSAGRLFIVLIALASVFLLVGGEVGAREPVHYVEYRVVAGDTLWDIARGLDVEGTIPAIVSQIRDANGLETSVIQVGQHLRLPS